MPGSPDELFSFDLMISEEPSISAQGFQATIDSITGPVGFVLTFDIPSSENGDYSYTFGDWPDNGNAEPLVIDDIMARYAFIWDGTEGNYTFTFDLGTGMSYILLDDLVSKEALQLPTGPWYDYPIISADSSSFTVHIPEPTTLVLFGLGSLVLLKQRRP
jgi:hypothetical protein